MPDVHVRIEIDPDNTGNQGKAIRELTDAYSDFYWPSLPWWHKPPPNARGRVARVLSKHGCKGRLSVEPHTEGTAWDAEPTPVWTSFTPRTRKRKRRKQKRSRG